MDRFTLLTTALCAGGLYAATRLLVVVLYPPAVSYIWQFLIGPPIASRWPTAAQAEDNGRLSYLPVSLEQPFVIKWGFGSVGNLAEGLRDGLLLGVFVALAPEIVAPLLTVLAAVPLVSGAWRMSLARGAARTDAAFDTLRGFLIYLAIVQAITVTGLLRAQP